MITVGDWMMRNVAVAQAEEPAEAAFERMEVRRAEVLPVVRQGRVVGLLHRATAPVEPGTRVADLMEPPPMVVSADERPQNVLRRSGDAGSIPVVRRGRLVGMTSAADLTACLRAEALTRWME